MTYIKKNFYLLCLNISFISKQEIIHINNSHIYNNFLYNNRESYVEDNSPIEYDFFLPVIGSYMVYMPIIYLLLNKTPTEEHKNIKERKNFYIKIAKGEDKAEDLHLTTKDFLIVYERAYYYFVLSIFMFYCFLKYFLLTKEEKLSLKKIKLIILMTIWNMFAIYYIKKNYTNRLGNNFIKSFDGKFVILSILYPNTIILILETINYNKKPYVKKKNKELNKLSLV